MIASIGGEDMIRVFLKEKENTDFVDLLRDDLVCPFSDSDSARSNLFDIFKRLLNWKMNMFSLQRLVLWNLLLRAYVEMFFLFAGSQPDRS